MSVRPAEINIRRKYIGGFLMPNRKKKTNGFWSYLVWLILMSIVLATTVRGEDRALLIGVGRYAHFDDRLKGVSLDLDMMTEIAQLLGFQPHTIKILDHEHATTANVHHALENWLVKQVGPQDRVLIYFSGHGSQVPDENHDERDRFDEVLLLYDTSLTVKGGRQSLDGVLHDDRFHQSLSQIKSRNILIILDACHSGSATRNLRITPRTIPVKDAQVKYLYYSPLLEAAGNRGKFDVMEPAQSNVSRGRYVAIAACREDEKTVATAQGSIFTLALRQAVRSAAMAGQKITPEELQQQTTAFIQAQIRSDVMQLHPQINGNRQLRKRPLELVELSDGNGIVRQKLEDLAQKSFAPLQLRLNKTCFEPGDVLELNVRITEPGYLNIISVTADDRTTVLFPNRYHPSNTVSPGSFQIPNAQMDFELVSDGPPGPQLIAAYLSRSPENSYKFGFRTRDGVLADLSPISMRSLVMRPKKEWLATGKVSVEIQPEGQCR